MHTFHKRLISLRAEKKISQIELAESINVSRQTLSKWENGIIMPDAANLVALATYFDVSVDYLLGLCDRETSPKISHKFIIYAILLITSLLGFFILMLLSSYHPCEVWVDGIEYTGLSAYIQYHNLQWLIGLLCITTVFSTWKLWLKEKLIKIHKDIFQNKG